MFGDSGNASPQFTISGPSASQSSGSAVSPNLVASPSTQPSSSGIKPQLSVSTTSGPSLPMTTTLASDPSARSTTSTLANVPQAKSSPTGHGTLSTTPSRGSDSSSGSMASISPTTGLNKNRAIPLLQNLGGMIAGALVSILMMFFL